MSTKRTISRAELRAQGAMAEREQTGDFIAERIAAVKAQVEANKIDAAQGSLTIRHLEALAEMIVQGFHTPEDAA